MLLLNFHVKFMFSWYVCSRDEIIIFILLYFFCNFIAFFGFSITFIINICNCCWTIWHNSNLLTASIMAISVNVYKGNISFNYINIHSFMFCPLISRWDIPVSCAQTNSLASVKEFLVICFQKTSSYQGSFDNLVLAL